VGVADTSVNGSLARVAPCAELRAALKVRQRAEGSVGTVQKSGVRNRVSHVDIEKRSQAIKAVSEMIVPVKRHAASAETLGRARYEKRSIQTRAESK